MGLTDAADKEKVAVEIGIKDGHCYGSILQNGSWNQVNYTDSVAFKSGAFAMLRIDLTGKFESNTSVEAKVCIAKHCFGIFMCIL